MPTKRAVSPAVLEAFLRDVERVVRGEIEFRIVDGQSVSGRGPGGGREATITVSPGARRYVRLVRRDASASSGGSAYGFVDLATGSVLMAATWAGPDPVPRGNLVDPIDPSAGRAALGRFGVRYLDDPALDRTVLARLRERYAPGAPARAPVAAGAPAAPELPGHVRSVRHAHDLPISRPVDACPRCELERMVRAGSVTHGPGGERYVPARPACPGWGAGPCYCGWHPDRGGHVAGQRRWSEGELVLTAHPNAGNFNDGPWTHVRTPSGEQYSLEEHHGDWWAFTRRGELLRSDHQRAAVIASILRDSCIHPDPAHHDHAGVAGIPICFSCGRALPADACTPECPGYGRTSLSDPAETVLTDGIVRAGFRAEIDRIAREALERPGQSVHFLGRGVALAASLVDAGILVEWNASNRREQRGRFHVEVPDPEATLRLCGECGIALDPGEEGRCRPCASGESPCAYGEHCESCRDCSRGSEEYEHDCDHGMAPEEPECLCGRPDCDGQIFLHGETKCEHGGGCVEIGRWHCFVDLPGARCRLADCPRDEHQGTARSRPCTHPDASAPDGWVWECEHCGAEFRQANTLIAYRYRDAGARSAGLETVLAGSLTREQADEIERLIGEIGTRAGERAGRFLPVELGLPPAQRALWARTKGPSPEFDHPWNELAHLGSSDEAPTLGAPRALELLALVRQVHARGADPEAAAAVLGTPLRAARSEPPAGALPNPPVTCLDCGRSDGRHDPKIPHGAPLA